MERQRIASSNLHSVGHDDTGLEVQFHAKGCASSKGQPCDCAGGDVFHYAGVPSEDHQGLLSSSSPGSFFHHRIKKAYPGRKV